MSDRSPSLQLDSTKVGVTSDNATDLSELKAHKSMHADTARVDVKSEQEAHATPLDLSSASIPQTEVQRMSTPLERRMRPLAPSTSMGRIVSPGLERAINSGKTVQPKKPNGIFTNPHYPYRGGPFSRLVTFFANLLKALERLFLALLGGGKTAKLPQPKMQTPAPPAQPASGQSTEKKQATKKAPIRVHRS